jgi:hypothetical protein
MTTTTPMPTAVIADLLGQLPRERPPHRASRDPSTVGSGGAAPAGPPAFVVIADACEVLGVWLAESEALARRALIRLKLEYPDCGGVLERAEDFDALKARLTHLEFGTIEPEGIDP